MTGVHRHDGRARSGGRSASSFTSCRAATPQAPGQRVRPTRRRPSAPCCGSWRSPSCCNVGLSAALDHGPPRLRDPEYGKRLERVHARIAEHPGRPLVLVLGSSRTAMGVRPDVLADEPAGPLVFNFSLVGSGPVMELMAFRRALADGVRPAAVVVEYWPAFLREDGGTTRRRGSTWPGCGRWTGRWCASSSATRPAAEAAMREQRLNPWYGHRRSLINQLVAEHGCRTASGPR